MRGGGGRIRPKRQEASRRDFPPAWSRPRPARLPGKSGSARLPYCDAVSSVAAEGSLVDASGEAADGAAAAVAMSGAPGTA